MNRKKSQAHVEMMISFVLFVGALIAVYIFISPLTESNQKSNLIKITENIITKNLTYSILKLSMIINDTNDNYIFIISPYNEESSPPLQYVEVQDSINNRKFVIYMSDVFPQNISTRNGCSLNDPCNFSIGSFSTEDIYFYEKIMEFQQRYVTDYPKLKKSLGITGDFSFKIRYLDDIDIPELSVEKKIPGGIERYAVERPIRVINYSGNIKELILNINAW